MSAPRNPTAFPMQDAQAIHAYAQAKVLHIEDFKEREAAYLMAREEAIGGMTLRDYYAGDALKALIAGAVRGHIDYGNEDEVARRAFHFADDLCAFALLSSALAIAIAHGWLDLPQLADLLGLPH